MLLLFLWPGGSDLPWAFPRGLRHFGGWASRQFPESTLFIGVAPSWENAATSFSAAPVLRVTFNALLKVCSSVSNFFCVSLLRRPQTRQSRKALFRYGPNRQVEARCFKLVTNVETLSPLHWMQLWNLYRSTMTSFCGAKWFLRIVESCVYVFAKGAVGLEGCHKLWPWWQKLKWPFACGSRQNRQEHCLLWSTVPIAPGND